MKLGKKNLNNDVYLIAEAGSNHNGSYRTARRLVVEAALAGAAAVKFQLFSLENLIAPEAFERALGIKDPSWRQGFRKLEFPLAWLPRLRRVADRAGIDLLCTPFDLPRLARYLEMQPPAVKIASGDVTFAPLLQAAGRSGLPVILSTGAAKEEEIASALALTGRKRTVLLDCVMAYPAQAAAYGLSRMEKLGKTFATPVGISDHTRSDALASILVQRGACVVEKHFTLDRRQAGADHAMSMEPEGLRLLVVALQEALALRIPPRGLRGDERERVYARRAIYARTDIAPGELLTADNCIALRPAAGGIAAWQWDRLLGTKSERPIPAGALIPAPKPRKSV